MNVDIKVENNGLEDLVRTGLCEPMPSDVESQLRHHIETARGQLAVKKRHVLTRRRFGLAVAAGGCAAAVAIPLLMTPPTPAAWAQVVSTTSEFPWIHFSGTHFKNETRMQFWVSFEHGILAMQAGDTEFAVFQNKETKTMHSYRDSEDVVHQEAYRRIPGALGHLETLMNRMSTGARTLEIAGSDEIIAQSRRQIRQNGKDIWKYEFTLNAFDEGRAEANVVVFLVDAKTGLPSKWILKSIDGSRELRFDVDYPSEGPMDIYALGVPRTLEVVVRD